ncbi:MAG: hypothetical protein K2N05_05610 [Muribaculaceae bacterium]|nr:hypothetical protein [Muribaculaceae bacterium]
MATDRNQQEREKYVRAFNDTMIKIWREQIALLGVVDTGALYRSTVAVSMNADGKFTSVTLAQSFNIYGLYADYGVGSNTPRGNPGDLGRDNKRKRRRWFSRKYFASVMNIREFFADNLGKQLADTVSNALTRDISRRFVNP